MRRTQRTLDVRPIRSALPKSPALTALISAGPGADHDIADNDLEP